MQRNPIDSKSSETSGFHLFIELDEALTKELEVIIQKLATQYGGPVFMPHITLRSVIPVESDENILSKAKAVAEGLSPFTVTLGELGTEDAYFKALYIKINDSGELAAAHTKTNKIFSMEDGGPYIPHVSLLYGNYAEEEKAKTITTLQSPSGKSFVADKLHVYRTEGEVQNWKKIGGFTLQ